MTPRRARLAEQRLSRSLRNLRDGIRAVSLPWALLLATCVVALGAMDAVLLHFMRDYFGGGYNGVALSSAGPILRFALCALLLDLAFVLAGWAIAVPLLRRTRLSAFQVFGWTAATTLGTALWIVVLRYNVHTVVGRLVDGRVLMELTGGSLGAIAAFALPHMRPLAVLAALTLGGLGVVWAALRILGGRQWVERTDFRAPGGASLASSALFLAALGLPALTATSGPGAAVRVGLENKPSAALLRVGVQRLTDFDRDGAGWLSRPADPAPFDARISPYATDLPENGVDENGRAGDHPAGFERLHPVPPSHFDGPARPHLLLVYLEGFRADRVGATLNGHPVTPFLDRLAREGGTTPHAYAHSPFTVRSRAQLFGGTLNPQLEQVTLIDDFKDRGYRVAYFSGQDDTFGGGLPFLGVDRADVFYSARQDVEHRVSRSTHPSSLQVSWQTLNERVFAFLDHNDPDQPLFLYVNFVDTHFPYYRGQQENLLDIDPVAREEIRASNAQRVFETYTNAAANVDRAIQKLVQRVWRNMGRENVAILVVGDHGEAFYESGFLGHGSDLDAVQTRLPLILWGIGGVWPEPIGAADLRGLLHRNLPLARGPGVPRPRFEARPERVVFQYIPTLKTPTRLALRRLEDVAVYEFESGRTELRDRDDQPRAASAKRRQADFRSLILNWEALRLEDASRAASAVSD